jgi:hypothetical protein
MGTPVVWGCGWDPWGSFTPRNSAVGLPEDLIDSGGALGACCDNCTSTVPRNGQRTALLRFDGHSSGLGLWLGPVGFIYAPEQCSRATGRPSRQWGRLGHPLFYLAVFYFAESSIKLHNCVKHVPCVFDSFAGPVPVQPTLFNQYAYIYFKFKFKFKFKLAQHCSWGKVCQLEI